MIFSSDNAMLWEGVLQFFLLSALLSFANLLRRKISLIRKLLIPTSVLAGFLGLILRETGILEFNLSFLKMITYHSLAIGFISLSLRVPRRKDIEAAQHKDGFFTSVNSGALIVCNYLLQGIIGLAITIIASLTVAPGLFRAAGLLLPMGYGQGPGQANNIGSMFEQYGFVGGQSFGLAIAGMGFLWASFGGIAYLYYLSRKGKLPPRVDISGTRSQHIFEEADELPLTESADRLTIQFALIFLVYGVTYGLSAGLLWILGQTPSLAGLAKTLTPLIWGFNFLIGSLLALLLRNVFVRLRERGWMKYQYQNTYILNRISGLAFDLMIVASISTIQIDDLKDKWLIFLIITVGGGFATLFYNIYMSKIVYPDYPIAGMLGMYGMMTGTASEGIMLLREVDPLFQTPMSGNLVSGSSTAIIFGLPVLLLIGLAPQSATLSYVTLGACILYWVILHRFVVRRCRRHNLKSKDTDHVK